MTSHHRLDPRTKDGIRPITPVMKSVGNKAELMSHLWKVRYAENAFKKIRITEDHTWQERQEIRRWVSMANGKNRNEEQEGTTNFK